MTVTQIGRGPLVEAPTPAKRTGGLLDVADVRDGVGWLNSSDMFVSWNCIDLNYTEMCAPDPTPSKTFQGPTVVDGTDFVLYLGGQCKPLSERANVEANVSRVFDLRESRMVEQVFEGNVLQAGSSLGTVVSPADALSKMEEALAFFYAGVGTIHLGVRAASLLLDDRLLVEQGGKFYTHLGTKVVVGAGYTGLAMYGTGDVVIFRGPKQVVEAPNTAQNETNVLAERAYVAVADCVVYKITGIPGPA
jgi:hypothetical protein